MNASSYIAANGGIAVGILATLASGATLTHWTWIYYAALLVGLNAVLFFAGKIIKSRKP